MPEAKATVRGQLEIMRMKRIQTIFGVCCIRCMLYSVYAVFGVCCARSMLYSVYAVLGECCTQCMLYSVSTHDHCHGARRYEGTWE